MEIEHDTEQRYGVGQKTMTVTNETPDSGDGYEIVVEVIGSASDLIDIGVWDDSGNGHFAQFTIDEARRFSRELADFVANPVVRGEL